MIPRRSATKAVIAPLAVLAMEAWRFLAMKGATCPIIAFCGIGLALVERHARAHDLAYGHPIPDLVEKTIRKPHGFGTLRRLYSSGHRLRAIIVNIAGQDANHSDDVRASDPIRLQNPCAKALLMRSLLMRSLSRDMRRNNFDVVTFDCYSTARF